MTLPRAREKDLVVHYLPDEVLIYDLQRDKAHCLNRTSGFVWKHCDGSTSVAEIADMLCAEMQTTVDESVVWLALDQLASYDLLQERAAFPVGMPRISRRGLVRTLGAAAIMAPLITSIIAPTAAEAATMGACGAQGDACVTNSDCCSQNCNIGTCGPAL